MSRFFHGAALAAAAAGGLSAAVWNLSSPLRLSASPASSPSSTPVGPAAAATGHLALVRAHPGLRDLNAMLTRASFLVDSTQALLAAALRCAPLYPSTLRQGRDFLNSQIPPAESEEDHEAAEQAEFARTQMALLDAREGHLDRAVDAITRLAAERPGDATTCLYAAALCHVLGRHDEGVRLLRGAVVPNLSRLEHKMLFVEGVLVSTLGSPPRAVAGSEELVLRTTLGLMEMTMWSVFQHGDLPERLQVLALMAFFRGIVVAKLGRDDGSAPLEGSQEASSPPQAS